MTDSPEYTWMESVPEDRLPSVANAIAESRRRDVLRQMHGAASEQTVEELATRLDGESAALKASLHHQHLPVLDDCGLVVFDPDAGVVEPGPFFHTVVDALY